MGDFLKNVAIECCECGKKHATQDPFTTNYFEIFEHNKTKNEVHNKKDKLNRPARVWKELTAFLNCSKCQTLNVKLLRYDNKFRLLQSIDFNKKRNKKDMFQHLERILPSQKLVFIRLIDRGKVPYAAHIGFFYGKTFLNPKRNKAIPTTLDGNLKRDPVNCPINISFDKDLIREKV